MQLAKEPCPACGGISDHLCYDCHQHPIDWCGESCVVCIEFFYGGKNPMKMGDTFDKDRSIEYFKRMAHLAHHQVLPWQIRDKEKREQFAKAREQQKLEDNKLIGNVQQTLLA